jgi:hypothetical protein
MHGDVSRFNPPKAKLNYPCSIPGEGHSGVCPQLSPIAISSEAANAYLRRQDYQGGSCTGLRGSTRLRLSLKLHEWLANEKPQRRRDPTGKAYR